MPHPFSFSFAFTPGLQAMKKRSHKGRRRKKKKTTEDTLPNCFFLLKKGTNADDGEKDGRRQSRFFL